MSEGPGESPLRELLGSIRVRIIAAFVVLLTLAMVGATLLERKLLHDQLDEEVRTDLRAEAEEFRRLRAAGDPQTGKPFGSDLQALFDAYFEREIPDEGEAILAFLDGELINFTRAQDAAAPEELQEAIRYWLSPGSPHSGVVDTPAGPARYVMVPVEGGARQGLFVVANFPRFERGEIDEAIRVQVVVLLVTLVVAAALTAVLAGRILRPLRSLADTARTISESDLTRRIPVRGDDEASQIARAFNDMLVRLEQAFAAQRQFLDDAGHELRAPLTVIRGNVELLDELPPDERREIVALVVDEIDRMDRICNDLLLLAQTERPGFTQPEPVELATLTEEIHRKARALASRAWTLEACGQGTFRGDRQRLTQAVMQLAVNACQHTAEGDRIRLGSSLVDGTVSLWVHDSGPGVPVDQAQRIFERFTRGRPATDGSGAGLGLSIVRAIAEAHGGTARLDTAAAGGACFVIELPADDRGP